jgi:ubiquinone/menaquinone biosynthesis C-methylase UbiE
VNSALERVLDAFFIHPNGWRGRIGGAMMEPVNARQERWALRRPEVVAGARILAVGYGTGQGLAMAAAAVSPGGQVIGVDPSSVMQRVAAGRCAAQIASGVVVLRAGSAENTGCADASIDLATSVNNVMFWDVPAGFAEMYRVLRPGGCLMITAHRPVLGRPPEAFVADAQAAGFHDTRIVSSRYEPVYMIARRG